MEGVDAGNYSANATTTATANITEKTLAITATGISKTYNGKTDAEVTLSDDRVTNDILSFTYDAEFVDKFKNIVNPVLGDAEKDGLKVYCVTAPNSSSVIEDFRHATQSAYPFYTADDLLLKTIQRSNPGLVLWKDGKIIQKWHIKNVPSYVDIKSQYMN